MTYEQVFDASRSLVTVKASGPDDMKSSLEALRMLRADPRFRDDYRILLDLRASKYVPVGTEFASMGIVISSFFGRQLIALVVDAPDVAKLQEFAAIITSGKADINVFNSADAAERWLLRAA